MFHTFKVRCVFCCRLSQFHPGLVRQRRRPSALHGRPIRHLICESVCACAHTLASRVGAGVHVWAVTNFVCVQGYWGCAIGKAKQAAKTEIEKLQVTFNVLFLSLNQSLFTFYLYVVRCLINVFVIFLYFLSCFWCPKVYSGHFISVLWLLTFNLLLFLYMYNFLN